MHAFGSFHVYAESGPSPTLLAVFQGHESVLLGLFVPSEDLRRSNSHGLKSCTYDAALKGHWEAMCVVLLTVVLGTLLFEDIGALTLAHFATFALYAKDAIYCFDRISWSHIKENPMVYNAYGMTPMHWLCA